MRLMRTAAVLAVLFLAALPMCATETPLVISGGGGLFASIEPGVGTITLYGLDGQLVTRYSGSTNFITDLRALRDRAWDEQNGEVFSVLRVGSPNFLPTPVELMLKFPNKQTLDEKEANIPPLQARALKAEQEFWAKPPEYDGVVRGAFNGSILFLGIPSLHALLIYEVHDRNKGPEFKAWRNVGPDLMVPQMIASTPTPVEIFKALPEEDRKARDKELEDAFKKAGDKAGSLTLQACDWWLTAFGDRFLLVDLANRHLVTYLYEGKKLKLASVRNYDIDLLIPTGLSTTPNPQKAIDQFGALNKQQIDDYKFVLDRENLSALIAQSSITNAAKISPVQISAQGGDVILNFTELHKLFVYRILGQGNSLELVAVRDGTVDIGLQLLADRLNARVRASDAVTTAGKQIALGQVGPTMMTLQYALKEDATQWTKVEKDLKFQALRKRPEWEPMIEDAKKRAAEEDLKRAERAKMVEEMKAKRAALKGGRP